MDIEDNGLTYVSDNSEVLIICTGSGTLSWHSSLGADIPVVMAVLPTIDVFQRRDTSTNRQTLIIQSFSNENIAIYTCRTDLSMTEVSIFVTNGTILAHSYNFRLY